MGFSDFPQQYHPLSPLPEKHGKNIYIYCVLLYQIIRFQSAAYPTTVIFRVLINLKSETCSEAPQLPFQFRHETSRENIFSQYDFSGQNQLGKFIE